MAFSKSSAKRDIIARLSNININTDKKTPQKNTYITPVFGGTCEETLVGEHALRQNAGKYFMQDHQVLGMVLPNVTYDVSDELSYDKTMSSQCYNKVAKQPFRQGDDSLLIGISQNATYEVPNDLQTTSHSAFLCSHCNTVMGDSLNTCGDDKRLNVIICLKVTDDVVVEDELQFGLQGKVSGCVYKPLQCGCCQSAVGMVLHSTARAFTSLRKLFLLHKENISCYVLQSRNMVPATEMNFELKTSQMAIKELKQELVDLNNRLELVEQRLGHGFTQDATLTMEMTRK
ncbi:protein Mis18-beta-like [Acipenser ruthenus]|uniref:protein Mis18-beta-like n=1 Tax=Acipenser ruthenus TaxID=7906 RepID=UPI0027417FA8|nr:protein Mis18-beta-like [Acipenser ruthenus]